MVKFKIVQLINSSGDEKFAHTILIKTNMFKILWVQETI